MKGLTKSELDGLLSRRVESIVGEKELRAKLSAGKKLLIKHGVDPTTADLHIGHATAYHKMREFQNLGHTVQFLVGGFTARFGDPTERTHIRKLQSREAVMRSAKNYLKQALKILDPKRTEVRYNSEWYDQMSAEELLKLMSHFTHQQMIERDMFQKRLKTGLKIGFHEPVYPLLQAYDSVMLKDDLTVIGTDQLFNEMRGRDLQRDFKLGPQAIIAVPLLVGTDGVHKMSMSLNNTINISDDPKTQYGKIMSIPDTLIYTYFDLATNITFEGLNRIKKQLKDPHTNPRDLKMELAHRIVTMYHGRRAADKAQADFVKVFQKREYPSTIETKLEGTYYGWRSSLPDIMTCTGVSASKSDARRLIEQGSVRLDDIPITSINTKLNPQKDEQILQVGKRKIVRLKRRRK